MAFRLGLTIERFLPRDVDSIEELAPEAFEALQKKVAKLYEQLSQTHDQVEKEGEKRKREFLRDSIADWETIAPCLGVEVVTLKKKKGKVKTSALEKRAAALQELVQTKLKGATCLYLQGEEGNRLTLNIADVFAQVMKMYKARLEDLVLTEITWQTPSCVPRVMPPETLVKLRICDVDTHVYLADLQKLYKLQECTLQGRFIRGRLAEIGRKKELRVLRIDARREKGVSGSLGDLGALKQFDALRVLWLPNCGLTGDVKSLTDCRQLTQITLSDNYIGGQLKGTGRFPHLTDFRLANGSLAESEEDLEVWMTKQPKLRHIDVRSNTIYDVRYNAVFGVQGATHEMTSEQKLALAHDPNNIVRLGFTKLEKDAVQEEEEEGEGGGGER